MKLKSYIDFSNNRTLNEEFVGKLWRDITGKNKDRISECRNSIDTILLELRKKKDFFEKHSYLFKEYPFSEISIDTVRNLNFDDYVKRIINESVDELTIEVKKNYPSGSCYTEIEKFFKEIFIELFEKDSYLIIQSQIEFIKKYDSDEYSIFVTYINKIIYSLDSSDKSYGVSSNDNRNFIYSMSRKIEEEFLTDLIIHILKESNQIRSNYLNIYQQIKEQDENLFYYLNVLTKGDIKDDHYYHTLSNFLKSLVLRLRQKNHKYIITQDELNNYKYVDSITNDSHTTYASEYGVNFLDKIKIDLTKTKVSDLESFKSLKESIKRLEKFTKLDENIKSFNQIIDNISSYIKQVGYKLEYKFPDLLEKIKENNIVLNTQNQLIWQIEGRKINIDNLKYLKDDYTEIVGPEESKYYEDITLKKLNKPKYGSTPTILIDFKAIINNFQIFEKSYGDSIIQDLLVKSGNQFKGINTIKIVEKDTTNIWREDEQLLGGNVLYHGSIHYNLDKPGEIKKLIYKNSPYTLKYSGYGMYLTNLLSSAAHYQHLRATQGTVNSESGGLDYKIKQAFETPNSEYFPTIYRITLKPGVVFEHKPQGDTTCDWNELNHYRNIGSAGYHSGNSAVSGGDTVEVTIVDENSIIKVEKVKPSEILNLDDDIWNRGSKQLSKDEFLKWYKDLIQKRKENLE